MYMYNYKSIVEWSDTCIDSVKSALKGSLF